MPDMAKIQTNLSSGELDPTMRGRIDTAAYQNGALQAKNVALLNTGGGVRRPGTSYVSTFSSTPTRLLGFDYDESSRFIIALQSGVLKVMTLAGAVVTTLSGPWVLAELRSITYAQLGDTLFLCHKNWMPRLLKRVTDASWTLSTFAFETTTNADHTYQPYENFAPIGAYIVPSAATGSITLTASVAIFDPLHVGTRWLIAGKEVLITAYTSATVVTATCKETLEGKMIVNPFRSKINTSTIEAAHIAHGMVTGDSITFTDSGVITTSQPASTGGTVTTTIIRESNLDGAHTITVLDADRYTFTQGGTPATALSTSDGGGANVKYTLAGMKVYDIREQTFSTLRGYPRAVCFHEQRLWFGGSLARPDGLWSSWIYRYFNFDVSEGSDNHSIQVTIGSDLGSAVKHLKSNRHLQVFTASKEFYCPPPNNSTLTPATFRIVAQTAFGAGDIAPQVLDGATLFMQANAKTVREYMYADAEQAYNSTAISLLSAHLVKAPVDMAVLRGTAQRGEQYAIFVNSDGTLAVFISSRADKMAGWTPWSTRTGDTFYSVCNVGNALYFVVLRDGAYWLEQFEVDDSQTLDHATSYSGAAASVWSVSSRFNGKTVHVVSANQYLGAYTVAGGVLDLGDYAVTAITVGFYYQWIIETMPPAIDTPRGNRHGALTRIIEAMVLLDSTHSITVEGQKLVLRQVADDMAAAPDAAGTYYRWFLRGYSRAPTVIITQDEPLPVRILAIKTKVIV